VKKRENERKNEIVNSQIKIFELFSKKVLTDWKRRDIIGKSKKKASFGKRRKIMKENAKMSTFMAKKETIERKWYVIDAAGKPMGKTAVAAATILRGKHRPEFTPHVDCGEFVIIINAAKAVLTGNKLQDKYYRHHSGYIGGLKEVQYKTLMEKKPELAMELAVKGMLPKNSIGAKSFTRLKVYAGENHNQEAQKPQAIEV